jgi:SAM-dependent methyltransferase
MARTGAFDRHAVEYDRWFDQHETIYLSELHAVRALLPERSRSVEIGVGTGRFAEPLGITCGVEPSAAMRAMARRRGIDVVEAVGESLPFGEASFDLVLMVTTLCFLDDVDQALREAHRILADGGYIVVGLLDRETELGRSYEARKGESEFYRTARFLSSAEVFDALSWAGFRDLSSVQTIFGLSSGRGENLFPVEPGCGRGLFVVVRGLKIQNAQTHLLGS